MRLKRICSLLSVLFVLCVRGNSLPSFLQRYVSTSTSDPLSCAHDGYYNSGNGNCSCRPQFTQPQCTQRQCQNDGKIRLIRSDQGCRCPPGFLGTSCEPVQCVPHDSHSFYEESRERSLYVLMTYNSLMYTTNTKSTLKDDPIEAVCSAVNNRSVSNAFWNIDGVIAPILAEDCVADAKEFCDPVASCDPNTLTTDRLLQTIDSSQPNSQVLVITNSALYDPSKINGVIRMAVARRIEVHVIALPPNPPIFYKDYNSLLGYTSLRTLTDATLGFFITPYSYANALAGTNTSYEAISQIIDFYVNGVEPVSVKGAKGAVTKLQYYVGSSEFYIAYRSMDANPENLTFLTRPNNLTLFCDTGFWKLWRAQPTDGKAAIAYRYSGTGPDFNVYLLSSTVLRTFVAVSSSEATIDASAPYAVEGASRAVVARVLSDGETITTGLTAKLSSGISFKPNVQERSMCQFSVVLGTVECSGTIPAILSLTSTDFKGSAVPFLCLSEKDLPSSSEIALWDDDESEKKKPNDDEVSCSSKLASSPFIKQVPLKRTFAVVARNVKDSNESDKSTVDNLFVLPNNVFDYLVPYMKQNDGYYTTWLSNIFSYEKLGNTHQFKDFDSFVTNVMDSVHNAAENNGTQYFNYAAALENALYPENTYSDVLVIIDSVTDGKLDTTNILERISSTRVRLFFVLIETYTKFYYDIFERLNELAAKSGGAAFRVADYASLQKFFEQYFAVIVGGDLVSYQSFSTQEETLESETFYVNSKAEYTAILTAANEISLVKGIQLQNMAGSICSANIATIGNDLALWNCNSGYDSDNYTLKLLFNDMGESSFSGRILLFERKYTVTTSIALSTDKLTDSDSGTICDASVEQKHDVTLMRSNGDKILARSAIGRTGCLFPYFVDYDWWCTENDEIFQVKVKSLIGGTHLTRTQILPCVDDGSSPCSHGVLEENRCSCFVGWEGYMCQSRICQNGGTRLSDNSCKCPDSFEGEFCHISTSACKSSPASPYLANEVGTLILVVERSNTSLEFDESSIEGLQGVQIIVVYYGGGLPPKLVLSTTDPLLLTSLETFGDIKQDAEPEQPFDAISLGLRNQLTPRSVVALLSRGGEHHLNRDIVNQLSLQRAELRVFSEEKSANLSILATLGNGMPFYCSRTEFCKEYFPKYVVPIASKATKLSSPILNVIASDFSCTGAITIPKEAFSQKLTVFIHLGDSNMNANVTQGGSNLPSTDIGSTIKQFTIDSQAETTITIFGSGQQCFYTVEILNYYKIGYVFQRDNVNENGYLGPVSGLNYLSLYAARSSVDTGGMRPFVQTRPVYIDGSLGALNDIKIIASTAKTNNCIYPYYVPVNCTEDIYAIQIQIHTFSPSSASGQSPSRQQQITANCAVLDSCSDNGELKDGVCVCNDGWEGVDCRLPICKNGGVRQGNVCVCSSKYYGARCEEGSDVSTTTMASTSTEVQPTTSTTLKETTPLTTSTEVQPTTSAIPEETSTSTSTTTIATTTREPPQQGSKRGMAFIVDSYGLDDTAFNSSIEGIVNFVNLFDMNNLQILLIENTNEIFKNPAFRSYTNATFFSDISTIFARRTNTRNLQLDAVFNIILQKSTDLNTPYNYVFYVAQTGGTLNDPTLPDKLRKSSSSFELSCVGISAYGKEVPQNIIDDLKKIGSTQTADDWYTAMKDMVEVAQTTDVPLPTPPARPACVGVQSSIYIAVDLSIGVNDYREQIQSVLRMFPTAFNTAYDIAVTKQGCSDEDKQRVLDAYKGYSRISGWSFYEDTYGVYDPKFCLSNMASVLSSVGADGGDEKPIYEGKRNLLKMFNDTLGSNCKCSRYEDKDTRKIVIWMPVYKYTSDKYKDFFVYPYEHYVVPYGYELKPGDFYYGLSQNNEKFDGALSRKDLSANTVVNTLWQKICKSSSPTNAP